MDDLLREFLTETAESLDVIDIELVKFEQDPNNAKILDNIFRLVHTIKGTCGFLGLPRLESIAHAAETLMGKFRDGKPVTSEAVSVVLTSIDRIKEILGQLEQLEHEPEGEDRGIIAELERMSAIADALPKVDRNAPVAEPAEQAVERPLRPGEVSLDELERAFRETPSEAVVSAAPEQSTERTLRPGEVSLDELERAFRETSVESVVVAKPQPPEQNRYPQLPPRSRRRQNRLLPRQPQRRLPPQRRSPPAMSGAVTPKTSPSRTSQSASTSIRLSI